MLNDDTIPVLLKVMGTPLKGDAELHLHAGMPLRVADQVDTAVVSTAATAAGFTTNEATAITNEISKRKGKK